MSLPIRKIGKTQVTGIGFGAMGISSFYGEVESDEERFKVWDDLHVDKERLNPGNPRF